MDVMEFEYHLEDQLFALQNEFISGEYQHGPYVPFTVFDPKRRQIHRATVKDRVVHQAIANVIEPLFEKSFIHDSYSCRVGKGTHAAVDRLRTFLRRASKNDTRTIYALKCDVRKFFASMDHRILIALLERRISDPAVMSLLKNIIQSFSVSADRGIPLGNLTSQLFANVYLHELDHQMKMVWREEFYLRYCDDFILLGENREELWRKAQAIHLFLDQALSLSLHPKKVFIRTWRQGVDFLGYVLFPQATVLRLKTADRMLQRVHEGNRTSYLGLCSHADAFEYAQIIAIKCAALGT